jgi:endonuclease III related protein
MTTRAVAMGTPSPIPTDLNGLFEVLRATYDVKRWWPSESPFEVMIGAILIQRTNWENVALVIEELRSRGLLEVDRIANIDVRELEGTIKPTGCFRQKAVRIKAMAEHLAKYHGSDPAHLLGQELGVARQELMQLKGVGQETADAILLFAGHRPRFVAAAYVSRILSRTGTFVSSDYDEVQAFVESRLVRDPIVYAELYALLVQLAKDRCRSRPRCHGCPIRHLCAFSS